MPDVATTATATATQTQAEGTRILGYYLGGGGARVDALFNAANFLLRNAAGQFLLTVNGAAAAPVLAFANDLDTGLFRSGTNQMGLVAGGTAYLTVDGAGYVSIGPKSTNYLLNVTAGAASRGIVADFNTTGNVGAMICFTQGGISNNCFGTIPGTGDFGWYANRNGATDGTERLRLTSAGVLRPGGDNTQPLAAASFRFTTAYLGSNPIVTSDMREKTWRGAARGAELAAAKRIAAELGFYQWNDAITERGEDGARLHFGVRAQAVWAIMADEGLIDPITDNARPDSRYAFLCYDEWDAVEAVDEVRDEEGNVVSPASPARPAGNRFGVRPDQLALFLIAAQEARLAALEAAS